MASCRHVDVGHDTDETAYADASSVSDDTIVEQVETVYDDAGNVLQTTTRQRFHNATGTGELTSPSGSQPKARVTYAAMYHDEIGRQIAVANYGTYGGATFSRASVVPTRTDTILVTSTDYNDAGQAYKTVDPAGREDRQVFDDAGRVVKTIQNYVDGIVSAAASDEDVTVEMTYNADGNLETLTAKNPTTGDQTTTYVYGTTLTDSGIATSTLKRAEIYPDSDDTVALGDGTDGVYDRIEFQYDRQQRVTEVKDQQETVHAFDFDALGRQTQDRVTTLGSGVDNAVRRIATTYDVMGRREKISSCDNPTAGSGSIVNEVQFAYDDFGQLVTEYQEHGGAVNTGTSIKVEYSYADGSSNTIRLTKMTYPDGRELNYDYGSTGSTDDVLSRVASLIDDDGSTHLADYSYLGRNTFVQTDYPEPDLRYDLAHGTGADPYDGPMDRFGRVTDLLWRDYASSTDVVRIWHGYDRAGNRLWREDPVAAGYSKNFDELYTYDGMYQLVDMQRGNLNAIKDGLVADSKTFAEDWSLDPTGNWSAYRQDDNGDGTWGLNQSRNHNGANEITQIAGVSTHVAHDRNGNMTKIPKQGDWSDHFDLTYDPWNRVVRVEDDSATIAKYEYDGRNFRVVKKTYDAGQLDEARHFLYNLRWQCLEERVDTASNADRQFVWGRRYTDDLVLRDRDASEPKNGGMDERLYSMQDPNWNVVAIARADGVVQERYTYLGYGKPEFRAANFAIRSPNESSFDWNILHTGCQFDAVAALYYNRNRHYSAMLGRFTSRDPIQYEGSKWNLYEYLRSAPVNHVDPLGLFTEKSCKDAVSDVLYSAWWVNLWGAGSATLKRCPRPPLVSCKCCYYRGIYAQSKQFGRHGEKTNITLCYNNLGDVYGMDSRRLRNVIKHELIHAYDNCYGSDPDSCNHRYCSELRAYEHSGNCDSGGSNRRTYETKEECVLRMAWNSTTARGNCGDYSWSDARKMQKECLSGGDGLPPWPFPTPPPPPPIKPPFIICFLAGTLVATPEEKCCIESLQCGDTVLACDLDNDSVVECRVMNVSKHTVTDGYYEVCAGDDVFRVTAEHPFYVLGIGWVQVQALERGARLAVCDGGSVPVRSVRHVAGCAEVYNLSVNGEHNYFVGSHGVLVHNKD